MQPLQLSYCGLQRDDEKKFGKGRQKSDDRIGFNAKHQIRELLIVEDSQGNDDGDEEAATEYPGSNLQ